MHMIISKEKVECTWIILKISSIIKIIFKINAYEIRIKHFSILATKNIKMKVKYKL